MDIFIGIFVIAALIFIGVHYGLMIIENKQLKAKKIEDEIEPEFSKYTPTRQVFIYQEDGNHIQQLAQMCLKAHEQANIGIRRTIADADSMNIFFDNGDIVMVYKYGAKIVSLSHSEITDYTIRVFFDNELPDGAIRACIEDLGLKNYLIGFGLCDNSKGEENNG